MGGGAYRFSFTTQNINLFLEIPLEFKQLVLTFAILFNRSNINCEVNVLNLNA